VNEFITTQNGFRKATSVDGVLTGLGADYIIIDDPLKPDEALSDTQRSKVNAWFGNTLYSRQNDKGRGCIILVMQRLHEEDLVGHVIQQESWELLSLPAIAQEDELHVIEAPYGIQRVSRKAGEPLHVERESLAVLERIRQTMGAYDFAGQYLQAPAPVEGGIVKREWFKFYGAEGKREKFDRVVQSWDTASKATELANFSVCTTWGLKGTQIFLLNVYRKQLDFPSLVRAAEDLSRQFGAQAILIEEAASGIQLAQQLRAKGVYGVKPVKPEGNKVMRLHAQSTAIENGFVLLPREAHWLEEYLHELTTFPRSKHSDQVDSTSQALAWISDAGREPGILQYYRELAEKTRRTG